MSLRLSECTLYAPAPIKSGTNVHAENAAPLRSGAGYSIVRDVAANPAIVVLGNSVSPSAILGRVTLVVIDAIKGLISSALAHVGNKVSDIEPSLADGDPATAIVPVSLIVWVRAAANHLSPRKIGESVSQSVSGRRWSLFADAAAGLGKAINEVRVASRFAPAAIALAIVPNLLATGLLYSHNSDKATEPNTAQIHENLPFRETSANRFT